MRVWQSAEMCASAASPPSGAAAFVVTRVLPHVDMKAPDFVQRHDLVENKTVGSCGQRKSI